MSKNKTVISTREHTVKVGSVRGVKNGRTQYLERKL